MDYNARWRDCVWESYQRERGAAQSLWSATIHELRPVCGGMAIVYDLLGDTRGEAVAGIGGERPTAEDYARVFARPSPDCPVCCDTEGGGLSGLYDHND